MLLLFDLRLATNDRLHNILLAEQYVFAAAQAACLEMFCREVAPANCVEIRNVFNESVNQI